MTHQNRLLILAILTAIAAALVQTENSVDTQYVPISKRYPGLDLSVPGSLVTVELVYDATCGGTVLFDKKFAEVQTSLNKSYPGKFSYYFTLQILPYHISSFKITQAIKFVNDQKGPAEALRVLRHFFDTNETWVESGVVNSTINAIMDKVAREVSDITGISEPDVRAAVAKFSDYDYEVRKWAKYVMGTLHVSGTPTVYINGARVDGVTEMTVDQLTTLLANLI